MFRSVSVSTSSFRITFLRIHMNAVVNLCWVFIIRFTSECEMDHTQRVSVPFLLFSPSVSSFVCCGFFLFAFLVFPSSCFGEPCPLFLFVVCCERKARSPSLTSTFHRRCHIASQERPSLRSGSPVHTVASSVRQDPA